MNCKHDLIEVTVGWCGQGSARSKNPLLKCKKCLLYFEWDGDSIKEARFEK